MITANPYLINFIIFNLVFLILQFAYILSLGGNFLQALPLPPAVYFELFRAAVIQLLLYGLLSLFQTILLRGIPDKSKPQWQIILYILTVCWIISLNCYLFPLSVFSRLLLPETPMAFIEGILIITSIAFLILSIKALWKINRCYLIPFIGCSCFLMLVFIPYANDGITPLQSDKQPNIIIIGIDSLSPERINAKDTPAIDNFLKHSIQFTETISPLARTYPAWSSILTGLYPLHHQARENLVPANQVKSSASVIWKLRQAGYYALFATDDRRFNNLDKDFGFQEIVGPQIGINDVLLGTFNDFPLSNFLVNFRISSWLFPYNHMNRASHYTYYPTTFNQALARALDKNHQNQPLMLAAHFTLPHWPYAWANSSPAEVGDEYSVAERGELYKTAVHEADRQVDALLNHLKKNNLLNDSLVILLSDHGETLYDENSRKTDPERYQGNHPGRLADYFKRKTSTTLLKSAGHGSDLLSPAQFHCLLGIQIIKNNQLISETAVVRTRVSLIDIAPTIEAFTRLKPAPERDGISLLDAFNHRSIAAHNRSFMLESGMFPNQFITRKKAKEYGKLLFRVNPHNDYLEIKKNQLKNIDAMKLYGILQGDWLLALYPDDKKYLTVILRLSDGLWSDDPASDFAMSSPLKPMLQQLRHFYQTDLGAYPQKMALKQSLL